MNQRRLTTSLVFVNYVDELRRVLIGTQALVAVVTNGFSVLLEIARQEPVTLELLLVILVYGLVLFAMVRRFAVQLISNLVILFTAVSLSLLPILLPASLITLTLLFISPFVVSRWVYAIVLVVAPAQVLLLELTRLQTEPIGSFTSPLIFIGGGVVFSIVLRIFRERLDVFLENARQNSDAIQRSVQLSSTLAGYTDETSLAQYAVRGLEKQFDLAHVGVYLTQQTNEATLIASTDETAVGSTLPVNTRTVVGRALLSGETITVRFDTLRTVEGVQRVAGAQAQAVLPLLDRDRVIGALDLYSANANAFTVDTLNALRIVALSLSQALRQARTLAEQQAALQQVRRITQENEANLREVERLTRQLTRQTWSDYVRTEAAITGVTLQPQGFSPGADWTPPMMQAVQRRRPVSAEAEGGGRWVAVPVELRNEVIGALQVKLTDVSYISETIELLRTVAERLAVSLENARLFEEAQATTIQEQRINEIIAEMQTSDSLEAMFQRTLEGLSEVLGTEDLSIRLGNPAMQTTNGGSHA
ncbi:MAG: GAF domain-containing protein [Anaerolineae bacterium]